MNDQPNILRPLKAIRKKCLDCCCGSSLEVKRCVIRDCSLWPYRLGKRPSTMKREYTEEERNAFKERAKAMRLKRKNGKEIYHENE